MPDDHEQFLDTDVSDVAIGAVLSQVQGGEERVIADRSLAKNETNYCVTRKELLLVVYRVPNTFDNTFLVEDS